MAQKEGFNDFEVRKSWASWMKETMKGYDRRDCWFVTLSFHKNMPRQTKTSLDKFERINEFVEAEVLVKRYIAWVERSKALRSPVTAFYIDPKGSMGNRHYHVVMMAKGLQNLNKEQWERRWKCRYGDRSLRPPDKKFWYM